MKILFKIFIILFLISCSKNKKQSSLTYQCAKGVVSKIGYKHHGFGFHDVIVFCNVWHDNQKYKSKMIYKYDGVQPENNFIVNDSIVAFFSGLSLQNTNELHSIKMYYRKLQNGFIIDHTSFQELCKD